jgi:hypothetical protein
MRRERPELLLRVRFEDDEPTVHVIAGTEGDERRLLDWLASGGMLIRTAELAIGLLVDLVDARDSREEPA